jgi:hypothetical protein
MITLRNVNDLLDDLQATKYEDNFTQLAKSFAFYGRGSFSHY